MCKRNVLLCWKPVGYFFFFFFFFTNKAASRRNVGRVENSRSSGFALIAFWWQYFKKQTSLDHHRPGSASCIVNLTHILLDTPAACTRGHLEMEESWEGHEKRISNAAMVALVAPAINYSYVSLRFVAISARGDLVSSAISLRARNSTDTGMLFLRKIYKDMFTCNSIFSM